MAQSLKEKILIISPIIPRPDMNSGDLRLSSLIGILAQKYEITFLASNYKAGDDAYIALLARSGVTVYAEQFSLWKMLKTEKFKVAILEFYFTAAFYLDRIRLMQPECRLVVDSVDVHYLRLRQKYDLTKNEADHAIYKETKEKELNVYRKADAVITVTKDDATALLEECSDIICEVVPNVHDICLSNTTCKSNTLIFVGGFSHDPNVDAVFYFCNEILPLIRDSKADVHFTIVGSNPPDKLRVLENEAIKVTGFVPETTPYLHQSCISVAPLRYGAGMKGKIGEAMSHGVPVVTTSVGAQGMGLANRKNVMIADSPDGFADAVLELFNDSQLYGTIRNNAIQIIEDNFTSKQVGQSMIDALERICENSVKKMTVMDKITFTNEYIFKRIKTRLSPC